LKKKKVYGLRRIRLKPHTEREPVREVPVEKQEDPFAAQRKLMEAENSWLGRWLRYRIDPDHFCLYPQITEEVDDALELTFYDDWYDDGRDRDEY